MALMSDGSAQQAAARLLDHLRHSTTDLADDLRPFEASDFTDPGIAAAERTYIFGRQPFVVAHRSELPSAGTFVTLELPNNQAVVVRQPDGGVKAFVNACRHRGAMVENRDSGSCRIFSCPYHGWAYNLDGSLRNVTYGDSFGEVDAATLGLVELPVEERHGFVWLVDGVGAEIDVAAWLGPAADRALAAHHAEELVCFKAGRFDEPVNWKIMQDAFLDGYHIRYAHPNSAGRHIHTNVYAVEELGQHCRFASPRKSIDQWLEPEVEEAGVQFDQHLTSAYFLAPNSTFLQQPDHFQLLTFRPHGDDPTRSIMEMRLIVPPLEASGLGEDAWSKTWDKNWDILMAVLRDEDFPLLRDLQQALGSEDAGPLVLGRNEVVNQAFHRSVAEALAQAGTKVWRGAGRG